MKVNAARLAEIYNVDARTVTNWINSTPSCPSVKRGRMREFDTAKVAEWHIARAVRRALSDLPASNDIEEWRARKMKAETLQAEAAWAEAEGQLIPLADYERTIDQMCKRIRAVLDVIPSKYLAKIQTARTPMEAHAVGETILAELLVALQGTAGDDAEISGDETMETGDAELHGNAALSTSTEVPDA